MKSKFNISVVIILLLSASACVTPPYTQKSENRNTPESFYQSVSSKDAKDTLNSANIPWKEFFKNDTTLIQLIDEALKNNQELNIFNQEIKIAQNNVRLKKATYLPFLGAVLGTSLEKPARYTFNGAVEENLNIADNKKFPDPLPNMLMGVNFSWELDIWKKLRNSKKAAVYKYLSTIEGKNFLVTRLVAEVASLYYELLSLDNQLDITKNYIEILNNALEIVKQEKAAARTTELAVKRFEAEVYKNQSRLYYIQQQIVETENKLNFLLGRFPQSIPRNSKIFSNIVPQQVFSGLPSQLLRYRPDVRQAEMLLMSTQFEIKSARAEFYPSLRLDGVGAINSYHTSYLFTLPQSILWAIAGEMITPLVNRNVLKANYFSAIAEQNKAAYLYEQKIINAYTEVSTQLSNIYNLQNAYNMKNQQVEALTQSIDISINLFKNARADYMEVLLTQRDALDARFELIETKKQQLLTMINLYRALGGGWK